MYKHDRESYILDYLIFEYDFNNTDEEIIKGHQNFIEAFRKLEYEDIYKDNMVKFLDTMINKVTNISSFDTIMYLMWVDKIKENVNDYIDKIKDKFEITTKKEIERIEEKNMG